MPKARLSCPRWIVRFLERTKQGRKRMRVQRYIAKNALNAKFRCARVAGRVVLSARRMQPA